MTIWDRRGVKRGDFDVALFSALEGSERVPEDFEGNGCSFIPDDLPGPSADKCPACHIHDYDYAVGGGFREFVAANRRLRRNLRKLGIGRVDAAVVYVGVALGGMPHFHWHGVPWHMPSVKQMDRAIQLTEDTGLRRDVPWAALVKALWAAPAFRKRIVAGAVVALATLATLAGLCASAPQADAFGIPSGRNQIPIPDVPYRDSDASTTWLSLLDTDVDNRADTAESIPTLIELGLTALPASCTVGDVLYDDYYTNLVYWCYDTVTDYWAPFGDMTTNAYDGDINGYADIEPLSITFAELAPDSVTGNSIAANSIRPAKLDDDITIGAGEDEWCYTYEHTGVDFEVHPCVTDADKTDITTSSSGTVWNIDTGAVGTAEIATDGVAAAEIAADAVGEPELKVIGGDTAADEECLTYETTNGDFEWQTCGTASPSVFFTDQIVSTPAVTSASVSKWQDPFDDGNSNTAADPVGSSSVHIVPTGTTMILNAAYFTVQAASLGATGGCKFSIVTGSNLADFTSRSTVNSASGDVGGDYTVNDIGETLTLDLGNTSIAAGSWFSLRYEDSDGAGADTCGSPGFPARAVTWTLKYSQS